MGIRWWSWALGAIGCILLGTIWASLSNSAVFPGLRAAILNFGEWVEAHHGALTLLATLVIAAFTGTQAYLGWRLWILIHGVLPATPPLPFNLHRRVPRLRGPLWDPSIGRFGLGV